MGANNLDGMSVKVCLIAANDRFALTFSLSGGNAHDARGAISGGAMIMDRACEGDETRQLVLDWAWFPLFRPRRTD